MTRLFVDVDDTLILWPKVAESRYVVADVPRPNEAVIRFVERWARYQGEKGEVIVWSLGGQEYAAKWGAALLSCPHRALSKDQLIPDRGDLFIDDDPLPSYRAASFHPDLLEEVRDGRP